VILLVDSNGNVYEAVNIVPGVGVTFTNLDGILDLSAYTTQDYGDEITYVE
jgi:hypothetical protein